MDNKFKIYLINKGLKDRTVKQIEYRVNKILESCRPLTEDNFADFQYSLMSKISNAGVNKYIQAIRHWNSYNGVKKFKIKALKEVSKQPRVLTNEQIYKIIYCKKNLYTPYIKILAHTGARPSEVLFLEKNNINIEQRIIYVDESKTGNGRLIPIPSSIIHEMENYKPFEKTIESLNKELKKRCNKIGIDPITSYSFRHSFITRMVAQGIPLMVIMAIVGHKKATTTQQYFHQNREMLLTGIDQDVLNWEYLSSREKLENVKEKIRKIVKVNGIKTSISEDDSSFVLQIRIDE